MELFGSRDDFFKWRQFEPEVILLAVGWYLRFSLPYRDVEELLAPARTFVRPRYGLEVGAALRPGNSAPIASQSVGRDNHPEPRVINTDKHAAYPPAIVRLKAEGAIEEGCQHRPVQYLEQCSGTGSSGDQTPGPRQLAFPFVFGALGAQSPATRRPI